MAKKRRTPTPEKHKNNMLIPVDCIPKHSQQPRSSPPKRRTDFTFFMSTPSSFSNHPGSSPGSSSGEVRWSSIAACNLRERRMAAKQFSEDMQARCINYQEGKAVCSADSYDVAVTETDSAVQDGFDCSDNRDASIKLIDLVKMSRSASHESSVSDSSSHAIAPGSVVWARTTCQTWWPAEVMEEKSVQSDPVSGGHVLVQFYGNNSSSWIDRMTNISTFEDSFEERCNNPSEDFQLALKQALQRKEEQLSSRQKLSLDMSAHSDQKDGSSEKWTSPSSSRTLNDFLEARRGKRERKRKVPFDEVTCPMKPERKLRRLKIMRLLGLAPPVGSPF